MAKLVVAHDGVAGISVTLDGHSIDDEIGADIPLDLGPHEIVATAPGHARQVRNIEATEATVQKIQFVFAVPTPAVSPAIVPRRDDDPPRATSRTSMTGKIVVGAGATVLVAGIVFGAIAYDAWGEAQHLSAVDVDRANDRVARAELGGETSRPRVITGVVGVGAGIYLWPFRGGRATVAPRATTDSV